MTVLTDKMFEPPTNLADELADHSVPGSVRSPSAVLSVHHRSQHVSDLQLIRQQFGQVRAEALVPRIATQCLAFFRLRWH